MRHKILLRVWQLFVIAFLALTYIESSKTWATPQIGPAVTLANLSETTRELFPYVILASGIGILVFPRLSQCLVLVMLAFLYGMIFQEVLAAYDVCAKYFEEKQKTGGIINWSTGEPITLADLLGVQLDGKLFFASCALTLLLLTIPASFLVSRKKPAQDLSEYELLENPLPSITK